VVVTVEVLPVVAPAVVMTTGVPLRANGKTVPCVTVKETFMLAGP